MSKELETFKIMKKSVVCAYDSVMREDMDNLEKSLKALEIIKNKRVDVAIFYEPNSSGRHRIPLTKEEFELLKEVLK